MTGEIHMNGDHEEDQSEQLLQKMNRGWYVNEMNKRERDLHIQVKVNLLI